MRRVLLLVVDGCTSRVLAPALEAGELPVLAELAAAGTLHLDCVSIFPSITPAATASIVTGQYPAAHGVAGMSWWNADTGRIAYFGDDVWTILRRGIADFLHGFLVRLNGERLQAPTLFQLVERHGRRAACFNHLIFRGDVAHEVRPPWLLRLMPAVPSRLTVYGPSWLCLGDFVSDAGSQQVDSSGSIFTRFGMDDAGTEAFLRGIERADRLPDFTVAYFADYDFDSHEQGPGNALATLRELDCRLGRIFAGWGGLERVLADTCIVLTADHAQSEVAREDGAIELEELLKDFRCADPARGWRDEDEVLLCPNMRAAEIYVRPDGAVPVRRVCSALLQDPRVDHVIWREPDDGNGDLRIATRDRGELRFRRAERAVGAVRDDYEGAWEIEGALAAVDATVTDGRLQYGTYPNALERVANGIAYPRAGRIWVTAHPGYEFETPGQDGHRHAGSHGTLHALDSLVPLLVAGAPPGIHVAPRPRIVDVAPLCAALLEVPFEWRPGDSR